VVKSQNIPPDNRSARSIAVRNIQKELNAQLPADKQLVVDGLMGSKTYAAYQAASIATKARMDASLASAGLDVESARIGSQRAKAFAKQKLQSTASPVVADAIRRAAAMHRVPTHVLATYAATESAFNHRAVNGSSRGLMQMQEAAWRDASAFDKGLGDYANNWDDPSLNARAAAAYQKVLMKQLRAKGYDGPISPANLYLAHQQGAGGYAQLYKLAKTGGKPSQKMIVAMTKNPPQDGLGVTTDPEEFLTRWLSVKDKKLSEYTDNW